MPSVSVIVPNYNHAPFLEQRMASILNQTYTDLEVIILDDCSADDSMQIIEKYRDNPKVSHIVYNDKNSGSPFKQWSKGIALAKGEWIWVAESDDVTDVLFLEKLVDAATRDPSIGLAYSATQEIDKKGNKLGINSWAAELDTQRWRRDYINSGQEEIKYYLRFRNCIPNASAVIFKKIHLDLLEDIVSKKYVFCGDWLLWIKILENNSVAYVSETLNYQRNHSASTRNTKSSNTEVKRVWEYIKVIKTAAAACNAKVNWNDPNYHWVYDEYIKKGSRNRWMFFLVLLTSGDLIFSLNLAKTYLFILRARWKPKPSLK